MFVQGRNRPGGGGDRRDVRPADELRFMFGRMRSSLVSTSFGRNTALEMKHSFIRPSVPMHDRQRHPIAFPSRWYAQGDCILILLVFPLTPSQPVRDTKGPMNMGQPVQPAPKHHETTGRCRSSRSSDTHRHSVLLPYCDTHRSCRDPRPLKTCLCSGVSSL